MEHRLLLNGKYKDCTFLQAEADRGYCGWILGSQSLPLSLRLFQHYLRQRHGGLFSVGKHKGRFFDEVLHSDPAYTLWALGLQDAAGNLREYQQFVASINEIVVQNSDRYVRSRTRHVFCCHPALLPQLIVRLCRIHATMSSGAGPDADRKYW